MNCNDFKLLKKYFYNMYNPNKFFLHFFFNFISTKLSYWKNAYDMCPAFSQTQSQHPEERHTHVRAEATAELPGVLRVLSLLIPNHSHLPCFCSLLFISSVSWFLTFTKPEGSCSTFIWSPSHTYMGSIITQKWWLPVYVPRTGYVIPGAQRKIKMRAP